MAGHLYGLPNESPVVTAPVGPRPGLVRPQAFGVPATPFGLTAAPGDITRADAHADGHGVVVIPAAAVPKLAGASARPRATERVIPGAARVGLADPAASEEAWARAEDAGR